jgi:translation initiation factor RLI1
VRMSEPRRPVAVLDYSKCHPEKCDSGICVAVDACPVKVIKQEAPYELPEIAQHMCVGYEYCVKVCPLDAIRMMR